MNKMGKKFIALLVVFTSILSLLPVEFGFKGNKANAASATEVEVGGNSNRGETVDSSKKPIYSTQWQFTDFTLSVEDKRVDPATLKIGETAITAQEVVIKKINRMSIDPNTLSNPNLDKVGTKLTNLEQGKRIGKIITGLPLGVNEILYSVKTTTVSRIQDISNPDNTAGILTAAKTTEESDNTINIEHANSYVQTQVEYIDFTSYIGGRAGIDSNIDSNTAPFKYVNRLYSNNGVSLRFEHKVPNSVTDLDYSIYFPSGVDTNNSTSPDLVFINGNTESGITSAGNTLTGSLQKTADSTMIVIAIRHPGALQYSYSIDVKYIDKDAKNDYSLKNPGITKYNYADDSGVKAYVGKKFTLSEKTKDVPTYEGILNVNKKATMLNFDPELGRSKNITAYKVTNYYRDKNGIAKIKEAEFKNNKMYIDFAAGETSNEIHIDIYEGTNGTVTGALLARYVLNVQFVGGDDNAFNMQLSFANTDGTQDGVYLTQPGTANKIEPFKVSRRTYDLYSNESVKVTLNPTSITASNEYFKVWLSNTKDSNLDETDESIANQFDPSTGTRKNSLDINLKKSQKMVVQAYYDEVKQNDDGTKALIATHPIGEKYVFYVTKNITPEDPNGGGTSSDDASLSGLKVGNGTLKTTTGSNGFASNTYDYQVTVPKSDTSSKITAIANNSKAKSITVTNVENATDFDLKSGEESELPLNDTGKTTLKIVVTAQDGKTTKTYNVVIENDKRSSSAKLKNVFLNVGEFNFNPEDTTTKVRVDQNVTSIKVTPIPEDPKSKVTVDGKTFSGTVQTISLKGSQETDVDINVTSEDGSSSETYTLEIYRSDSPIEDKDDEDKDNDDDIFYDEFDDCWVDTSKYEEWGKVNGKQVYFNNKGRQVKNQWITTKGVLYFVGSKGYRESGWRTESDGKSYYLDPSTGEMRTGWLYQNNAWYYLGLNGTMHKGWLYLNNKWYYFTPKGQMITNQSMFVDDKVYRFAQDGSIY